MPSFPQDIVEARLLSERQGGEVLLARNDAGDRLILRRLPEPKDVGLRLAALERVRQAELAGLAPILGVRRQEGWLEVLERRIDGFTLGGALDVVREHITVNVALSVVYDAAKALAKLHAVTEADGSSARLVHGDLTLDDLVISRRGETHVGGFLGTRGDLRVDVDALMGAMRALLATRAVNPKGAALLDRLAELEFASCAELARAIEVYLQRQDATSLRQRRQRFTSHVLHRYRPDEDAPFSDEESTAGDVDLEGQVLRGGGEAVAVGIAMQPFPGASEEPSIPSLDPDELELLREVTAQFAAPVFEAGDTTETQAELPPDVDEDHETHFGRASLSSGETTSAGFDPDRSGTLDGEGLIESETHDGAARDGLLAPAKPPEPPPKPAVQIGKYRVVASIGRGGMGEIYLGREVVDGKLGRLVALKVLGLQGNFTGKDEEALDMLLDEAKIMAHIGHENVLEVVDFGKADGRYFLATEYLEGRPLVRVMIEAYAKAAGLDYGAIAAIGAGAAHGLHAAHSAVSAEGAPLQVVHRDVSPQNIFVTYDGVTKVIDFGVARATERIAQTAVGLVKGKAAYMSPEQAEGKSVDARSDVFSLGICLWEMAAGCRLFKRDIEYDTLLAVQNAPIEPPSVVRGEPNPVLDHIILEALARDRGRRTQTAGDLAAQLEDYARGVGLEPADAVRDLLEGLFGEAKAEEQALIRNLERRSATPEEVAQLEALSGVSQHGADLRQITLVGAPDSLSALDDFGDKRVRGGKQVIDAVERLQAERSASMLEDEFDIAVAEETPPDGLPPFDAVPEEADPTHADRAGQLDAETLDSTQDGAGEAEVSAEGFDVQATRRLPAELVEQVRADLGAAPPEAVTDPRSPTAEGARPGNTASVLPSLANEDGARPAVQNRDPSRTGTPLPELDPDFDDSRFEPMNPASAAVGGADAVPTAAGPPPKKGSPLVWGLLAATFVALAIAGVLLWQMLPSEEKAGPTVALRTGGKSAGGARAPTEPPAEPSTQAPTEVRTGTIAQQEALAEAPRTAAATVAAVNDAMARALEPEPGAETESEPAVEPEPAAEPEPEPEPKPEPKLAVAPPPPPAPPRPAPDPVRTPGAGATPARAPKKKQGRLTAMLDSLREAGLDVTKSERTYLVDDGRGGTVVVDARSKITEVKAGGAAGYLVQTRASALTSVSWIGRVRGGPWRARGISVNDCTARGRATGAGVSIRYGSSATTLPAGGGDLYDVSVPVPDNAKGLVVEPLGIALGGPAKGAVRCTSGWWGSRVTLRRLPPGTYALEWTGPDGATETTLVVGRGGVENGELKRVRRL